MTEDKDVNKAGTTSTPADVTPAPSAETTPQPETPPAQDTGKDEKVSHREALIQKLTANKEQAPDTKDVVEEPEAKAEDTKDQPEANKTTETPAEGTPAPEPDDGLLSEQDKTFGRGAQARIRELVRKNKEAEGLAGFGADILDRAQKAGIPPQVFVDWVDTGADIFSNPQVGVSKLLSMAQALGWKPAQSAGAPEGFDTLLKKLEDDLEISPEAAKVLRSRLKPASPETPAPAAAAPVQQPPRIDANAAVQAKVVQEMDRIGAEYAAAHPADWKTIEAEAAKELVKFKGSPTTMWPGLFRNAVELVIAKRKAAVPAAKLPTRTLRPTTAPPGQEKPKSNRDRVLQKYSTER